MQTLHTQDEIVQFVTWLRCHGLLSAAAVRSIIAAADGESALVALFRGCGSIEPALAAPYSYLVMDRDDFPVAIRPTAEDAIAYVAAGFRAFLLERPRASRERLHAMGARYIMPVPE